MIKVENAQVWGFEHAVRACRNPLSSWDRSDSGYMASGKRYEYVDYVVGPKDLELMKKLVKAGREHRKVIRMIHVSMDITAPDYWFKEFSTYRIGVTESSTSTMHRLTSSELTLDDFSLEDMPEEEAIEIVKHNERRRLKYLESKDKRDWRALIQGLPMAYNYRRTVDMNYENVLNIIGQRAGHKLSEWREFVEILRGLPYVKELTE